MAPVELPTESTRKVRARRPNPVEPPELAPETEEPVSVENSVGRFRRRAEQAKRERPELAPEISRLLDQVAMDAAITDRAEASARIRSAQRSLESMLETRASEALNPSRLDPER